MNAKHGFIIAGSLAMALIAFLGLMSSQSVSAGDNVWTPTGGPLVEGGQVNSLAVHPSTADTLYAAAESFTSTVIHRSTNGAANWSRVFTGTTTYRGLAVAGNGDVYAAGGQNPGDSVVVKGSGGTVWSIVLTSSTSLVQLYAIAVAPSDNNTVYAAGYESGFSGSGPVVFRTQDAGTNWVKQWPAGSNVGGTWYAVAIHPTTPSTIFVAGQFSSFPNPPYAAIYRTTDSGANWTQVFSTTQVFAFTSLVIDSNNPANVYAGAGGNNFGSGPGSVYRSTGNGDVGTWNQVNTYVSSPLSLDSANGIIYGVNYAVVMTSTLTGITGTWNSATCPSASCNDAIRALVLDLNSTPKPLYAGLNEGGVYKSTNGGTSWTAANNGIESPIESRSIAIDPQNPALLYAAAGNTGGFKSTNAGNTWIAFTGISSRLNAIAVNPSTPSIVLAGGLSSSPSIYRSTDYGVNWTGVYTTEPSYITQIHALAFDPIAPANVYASGERQFEGVLLKSTNGGVDWSVLMTRIAWSPGFATIAVNPVTNTIVYAGGQEVIDGWSQGVIYRSTNGGSTWTRVMTSTSTIRSIAIDYQKPNVVYASDDSWRFYKSKDGGDTWSSSSVSGNRLAIDPRVPSHIYMAGFGVYGSVDGGNNWSWLGNGLSSGPSSQSAQSFAIDRGSVTQNLYLGLRGIWQYGRNAPQPGGTMTVTVPTTSTIAQAGNPVTITARLVDQYENWVTDGTQVSFFTDFGTYQGGTPSPTRGRRPQEVVNRTTTNGSASAVLTSSSVGTANVVIVSNGKAATMTVQFTSLPHRIFLPLIMRGTQ